MARRLVASLGTIVALAAVMESHGHPYSFALALSVAVAAALPAACDHAPTTSAAAAAADAGADTPPADRHVVVLFTSDEHSHLFASSPERDDYPLATTAGTGALVGGVARRATVLGRERQRAAVAGKDTLTLSAGDNQMGGLAHVAFQTRSVDYGLLATLRYDATTLGNHELDFGPHALAQSISAAKAGAGLPAIVASNVHFSASSAADDDLEALFDTNAASGAPIHPYRVLTTTSGVRVGLIGWVGVDAEHVAPNKAPIRFSSNGLDPSAEGNPTSVLPRLYADLQPIVDTLRGAEHVDLVIGLSHGGIADSSTPAKALGGEDALVAQNVHGLDLVISGHAHNADATPIVVSNGSKRTLVLNASSYGRHVGRVELVVHADGSAASWDPTTQALLPVDDTTLPDAKQVADTPSLLTQVEASGPTGGSYLEALLSRVTGAEVKRDPTAPGALYFFGIAKTDFDVVDARSLLAVSTDASLLAADAWGASTSTATDVALDSAGNVRASLRRGRTGVVSAADAFDVVPLGVSPVDGSIGYPLARAFLYQIELRGVFEASLELGPTDGDFLIGAAGVKVEYDATRPAALSLADLLDPTKGRVVRLSLDTNHADGLEQFDKVVFDQAAGISDPFALYAVVASSYVAQFANGVGATLKDGSGSALSVVDAIVRRADGSEVKQLEAFLGFLHSRPGAALPRLYDVTSPQATKRFVCVKGC